MARYIRPVPGGTVGRTDQGVDISAPPGTPILAITNERLMGVIQNWYKNQPFYWFQELGPNGKPTGIYNYVAEQIQSFLPVGTVVKGGQPIGTVANSGTGLELGYATRQGRTRAAIQGGYTEGIPTQAGLDYRAQVIRGGGPLSTLSQLWINNGGPPSQAKIAAAIAMAESHGVIGATHKNSDGSIDNGLWQINNKAHPQFTQEQLLSNPDYNAQAAVAVYKSSGWGAWTTFQSGAYKQYLKTASSTSISYGGPNGGMVRPGGDSKKSGSNISSAYQQLVTTSRKEQGSPIDNTLLAPFKWWWGQESSNWSAFFNGVSGDVDTVVDAGQATVTAAQDTVRILEALPWYMLRASEFLTGITLMGVGLYLAGRPSNRSGNVVSSMIAATPLGRASRINRARRAGRREGVEEYHRNEARRSSKASEAARIQKQGQAKRERRTN